MNIFPFWWLILIAIIAIIAGLIILIKNKFFGFKDKKPSDW